MTSEVQWRRRWTPTLASKPWQPLTVGGTTYLVKCCFHHGPGDLSYEFLMSDRVSLWHEELNELQLKRRAKKLNPSVEAPSSKLLSHIEEQIEEQPKSTQYEVTTSENDEEAERTRIRLKVTSRLAGLPFVWTFSAASAFNTMVSDHITLPLLIMVKEQQRREAELFKMLSAKDREIEDLRVQGAKSSRRHLETGKFDETVFYNNMDTAQAFEDTVKDDGKSAFSAQIQELYRRVMAKKAWLTRTPEDDVEGESLMEEDSVADGGVGVSVPSWANRIPGSVVGASSSSTTASPRKSPGKSPAKSPGKSPAKTPDPSPVKDTELLRRQALTRKLEEEEAKKEQSKAKKKKKIKF